MEKKKRTRYRACAENMVGTDSNKELKGNTAPKSSANGEGLRLSARIQEKQKHLGSTTKITENVQADKLDSGSEFAGSTNSKEVQLFQEFFDEKQDLEQTCELKDKKDKQKTRNWELWSEFNKQLFFEALNEYGKDFDAIQNYLAEKTKKKRRSKTEQEVVSKNKNQIRHFYYRTWNKISKDLQFPKEIKKSSQELYGLVNYGELRKKLRVLNTKRTIGKLSELVKNGITYVKIRGKTFRVKTPVCKAFKELNLPGYVEESRFPCKISIELIPKNAKAWATVQNVSHNPRVKVDVPLQRTLASVITFLENKWKSNFEKLRQSIRVAFGGKAATDLRIFLIDENDLDRPTFKKSETSIYSPNKGLGKGTDKEIQLSINNRQCKDCGKTWNYDAAIKLNVENNKKDEPKDCVPKDSSQTANTGVGYTLESKRLQESTNLSKFGSSENVNDHAWNIEHGWTAAEAGVTTVGEIYLMVGKNEKLRFEYCWEELENYSRTNQMLDKLTSIATALKKKKAKSSGLNGGIQYHNTGINAIPTSVTQHSEIPSFSGSDVSFVSAKPTTSEIFIPTPISTSTATLISESTLGNLMWTHSVPVSDQVCPLNVPTKIVCRSINEVPLVISGQFLPENKALSQTKTPPKLFKDLPKANRKLGRRPNFKKVAGAQCPQQRNLLPKVSIVNIPVDHNSFSGLANIYTWPKEYSTGMTTPISDNPLIMTPAFNIIPPLPTEITYLSKTGSHVPKRIVPTMLSQHFKIDENSKNFLANNENQLTNNLDAKSDPAESLSNLSWSALGDISLPESFKEGVNELILSLDLDDSFTNNFSLSDVQKEKNEDNTTNILDASLKYNVGNKIIASPGIQTPQKPSSPIKNYGSLSPTSPYPSFLIDQFSKPSEDLSLSSLLEDI